MLLFTRERNVKFRGCITEAYSKACQTSKMDCFVRIVNDF